MKFVPTTGEFSQEVPYFDEVKSEGGWKGHGTGKSMMTLKAEITQSVARLGGQVTGFVRGAYEMENGVSRDGFQIHYAIEDANANLHQGRIDVAALPVREPKRRSGSRQTMERKREQTLKMCLFMIRDALDGQWFLQMLSPGYAALMPWMLAKGDKTVTELWSESATMKKLLPPQDSKFEGDDKDVVEGDFREE